MFLKRRPTRAIHEPHPTGTQCTVSCCLQLIFAEAHETPSSEKTRGYSPLPNALPGDVETVVQEIAEGGAPTLIAQNISRVNYEPVH